MADGLPIQLASSRWQGSFPDRRGFQITVRQVKVARFGGECSYLQIRGLTQFRTRVTGWSNTGRVSTSCVRRHADRTNCKQEMESSSLPINSRLPVSMSAFKYTVSLKFELVQEERAASNVLSLNFSLNMARRSGDHVAGSVPK